MQLERREAIELVLSSGASSLSQVAPRLSSFDLKTTELEKSYKRSGVLILKHHEVKSCDREEFQIEINSTTYWTDVDLFRRSFFWYRYSGVRFDDRWSE